MDWIETTGRTIEEAKEQALDLLGVDDVDVEFEIIDEGRASFLGFGRRDARVRARLRPRLPVPKRERRRGKRRSANGEAKVPREPREGDRMDATGTDGSQRQGGSAPAPPQALTRLELAARAQTFLAGLMQEFGLAGEVRVSHLDDEEMVLDLEGEGLGVLVGPKASVLAAIQELTRSVLQAVAGDGVGRVIVDVAGYRKRRREALERFAAEQADIALTSGEERVLEPMSPSDRKVIHDVVAGIEGVATRSEGEEPERYVVIYRVEADVTDEEMNAASSHSVD